MKNLTILALVVVILAVCIHDVSAKPGNDGKNLGKIGHHGGGHGGGKGKGKDSSSSSSESDEGKGKGKGDDKDKGKKWR